MFAHFIFFQAKKQRRVFVCNSSAAVRPAVIRHGTRTRSQHRNFRERGQEGVSGWAKTTNPIIFLPLASFPKKIQIYNAPFITRLIVTKKKKRENKRISKLKEMDFIRSTQDGSNLYSYNFCAKILLWCLLITANSETGANIHKYSARSYSLLET